MTVSFPMYIRPETAGAHNIYWSLIRKHLTAKGIACPEQIDEPEETYEAWLAPDLLLSQTCGMPYRNTLHGKVQLIGTPDFRLEDTPAGHYRSAIVVRREDSSKSLKDFKDSVFAFNSEDSQSGYGSARLHCKPHGFRFQNRVATGGHRESTFAVADGHADIASIDGVTWHLLQTYDSHTNKLAVIDWTDPTPGLPYITSVNNNAQAMFHAISAAIDELPEDTRKQLGIHALVKLSAEDYLAVENPEA